MFFMCSVKLLNEIIMDNFACLFGKQKQNPLRQLQSQLAQGCQRGLSLYAAWSPRTSATTTILTCAAYALQI